MLKVLLLLGAFLFVVSSGVVIRDWDNPSDVVLLNEDNILDEDDEPFTPSSTQCPSSDCSSVKSPSSYNPYELFKLDSMFKPSDKQPYQEKQLAKYKEVLNG